MCDRELYQSTFSQIHSSAVIQWEDMEQISRRPQWRFLTFGIAAVLMISLCAVAVADEWFGLRELKLQEVPATVTEQAEEKGEDPVDSVLSGAMIGLQGFWDTPELQAMSDWRAFLETYDDGGALESLGNQLSGFEEKYGLYQVYTQEMADKLEEIVENYHLRLHTNVIDGLFPQEKLCAQVSGDFLGENRAYSAYMYEDGTFKFDGQIDLEEYGLLEYQFMRCVRGSFTDVKLYIEDVNEYQEWRYITECGETALLALGPTKGLIFVDLEDCFVSVHTIGGHCLNQEDMERFADTLDFSLLSPVKLPTHTVEK